MIAALEQLAARRREQGQGAGRGQDALLAALVNCGFPESGHNANALTVCSLFARQAGFRWAGGMTFGGANGLGEKPLAEWGGRTADIRMALNQAAAALAQGQAIPVEAQARAAKSAIPPSLYLRIANLGWKFLARPYGAAKNLRCHPYRN